jgi:sulfite reductase (NADPH) hemoprotein beta-component
VHPQKQDGYVTAVVTLVLGDLTSAQMRVIADLMRAYGDGTLRVTPTQNLVFRWVRTSDVRALFGRLTAAGLQPPTPTRWPTSRAARARVVQAGRDAVARSGPAAGRVRARESRLIDLAPTLDIKVSGCPNGCGQHHIAAVGFQGSLRKLDGRAVPQYFVMVGGGAQLDGATFGRLAAKIPARRAPQALERLADLFARERRDDESAATFFSRVDLTRVKALLSDLEPLTADTAKDDDFVDLAETAAFAPETTEGECAS